MGAAVPPLRGSPSWSPRAGRDRCLRAGRSDTWRHRAYGEAATGQSACTGSAERRAYALYQREILTRVPPFLPVNRSIFRAGRCARSAGFTRRGPGTKLRLMKQETEGTGRENGQGGYHREYGDGGKSCAPGRWRGAPGVSGRLSAIALVLSFGGSRRRARRAPRRSRRSAPGAEVSFARIFALRRLWVRLGGCVAGPRSRACGGPRPRCSWSAVAWLVGAELVVLASMGAGLLRVAGRSGRLGGGFRRRRRRPRGRSRIPAAVWRRNTALAAGERPCSV